MGARHPSRFQLGHRHGGITPKRATNTALKKTWRVGAGPVNDVDTLSKRDGSGSQFAESNEPDEAASLQGLVTPEHGADGTRFHRQTAPARLDMAPRTVDPGQHAHRVTALPAR